MSLFTRVRHSGIPNFLTPLTPLALTGLESCAMSPRGVSELLREVLGILIFSLLHGISTENGCQVLFCS